MIRRKVEQCSRFETLPGVIVEELTGAGENLHKGAAPVGVWREFLTRSETEERHAGIVLAKNCFADRAFGLGNADRQ